MSSAETNPHVGAKLLQEFRQEVQDYHDIMDTFRNREDIGEILRELASMQHRIARFRQLLVRSSGDNAKRIRIDEVDPFLETVKMQFQIWSRIQSVNEHEYQASRGY